VAIECRENAGGLHILDTAYWAEVVEPETGQPLPAGQRGELVLTSLGRHGSPLIRYRTGDLVRVDRRPCPCGRPFLRLDGGILGRSDDMIHVRGNNLHPSALAALIFRFAEVAEYRLEVDESASMAELRVEVEPVAGRPGDDLADRIGRAIRDELLFRADVRTVAPGTLPRYEMKAKRLVKK
jgi:phenylacetate-CoA ligase